MIKILMLLKIFYLYEYCLVFFFLLWEKLFFKNYFVYVCMSNNINKKKVEKRVIMN